MKQAQIGLLLARTSRGYKSSGAYLALCRRPSERPRFVSWVSLPSYTIKIQQPAHFYSPPSSFFSFTRFLLLYDRYPDICTAILLRAKRFRHRAAPSLFTFRPSP
jgi:hypothetical protein